jgi:Tfp pilus assembly protein PilN
VVKLNLLPAKVREAELLRLVFILGIAVYILAVGLLGWRYTVSVGVRSGVEAKISKVEAELVPLKAIADEVRKLTDEKTEQDAKKAKLGELAKRQAYLVRLLDALPDFMQGGQVWLTILDQTVEKGGARRISLEGNAASIEAWADFYNSLESQSLVSDLKIDTSPSVFTQLIVKLRKVYHFKISFILKEPQ